MNKTLLTAILILAISCLSFRWPVDNGRLTSNFGESRGDHFHDGIDMISQSDNVYPVEKGKLIFAWNKSMFPLQNYWGGGNYKIIKHDSGLLSVYMHLQDGEFLKPEYEAGDVIGYVGNTGHSYGRHIHFAILDNIKKISTNPFSFLPAYEDKQPPQVLNLFIRIGDRYTHIREKSVIRLTKHYPLLIEARDVVTGRENLGVYRLKAVFNGTEVLNTEYNSIGWSDKGLTVKGQVFPELTDEKGYYRVQGLTYNEGVNTLTVTASDFNGNTTEKTFTIDVHLDIQPGTN